MRARLWRSLLAAVPVVFCPILLNGCAAGTSYACVIGTNISILSDNNHAPITGVADHAAAPPGNQFQFRAVGGVYAVSGACKIPQVVGPVDLNWTSADPKDISMDSSPGATNGTATCINATNGSVAVTGTPAPGTGIYQPTSVSALMECK
jgi:hypothetical protein